MEGNKRKSRDLFFSKTEMVLFVFSLWAYAYFYQAGGWNTNSRFDLVRSIVEEGTFQIDSYAYNTEDLSRAGDHFYCDKAPGVSWMGVLPYSAFRMLVPAKPQDAGYLSAASYLVTVFTIAIPSAIAVSMLYVFLGIFTLSRHFRILITLGYALGTLAFPYATLFYGHQLAAVFLFSAFALLARKRNATHRFPFSVRDWNTFGIVCWRGLFLDVGGCSHLLLCCQQGFEVPPVVLPDAGGIVHRSNSCSISCRLFREPV